MNVAVDARNDGIFAQILSWVAKGWEGAIESEMIAALDADTIKHIARDCGIQPDQLVELAKAGPGAADEMPKMMTSLGIDPVQVETRFRQMYREMQIDCSHCADKARCHRDLAEGTASENFSHYCLNADHLASLRAMSSVHSE